MNVNVVFEGTANEINIKLDLQYDFTVTSAESTATADDILFRKTAWANGKKVVGTIETYNGEVI